MKILIYDDNPDYGGHQIMACHGAKALAKDSTVDIIFMLNPANRHLAQNLKSAEHLKILEAPCSTKRFQGVRNRFNPKAISRLARTFKAQKPELILAIQGDIEHSSQGVLAAQQAGIKCISYIAIPHTMKTMGAKWGALRDRFNDYLLNKPDHYITISESMKALLLERGVTKPITVVPNGISLPDPTSRRNAGPKFTAGLLGRIEFKQKRQDHMTKVFCNYPDAFKNCRLLMVGSGPDTARLSALVADHSDIELLPWMENPEAFYEQLDVLIIPSRFEGVPLVMLEALARGIPVLGSSRDGMKEVLPEAWTFEPDNPESLVNAFLQLRETWSQEIDHIQSRIISEHSMEAFHTNFGNAVHQQALRNS